MIGIEPLPDNFDWNLPYTSSASPFFLLKAMPIGTEKKVWERTCTVLSRLMVVVFRSFSANTTDIVASDTFTAKKLELLILKEF